MHPKLKTLVAFVSGMNKQLFFGTCFLLLPFLIFSQTKIIDSLQNELKKSTKDSLKSFLFTKLASQYFAYDTVKAYDFLQRGYLHAKKMNWDFALGDYYEIKGSLKQLSSQHDQAHIYLDSAIFYFEKSRKTAKSKKEIADVRLSIATCLGQKADILLKKGRSAEAIEIFIAALEEWKASDHPLKTESIGTYYGKMSTTYYELKQYEKALQYDKLSLASYIVSGNEEGIAYAFINVCDDFMVLNQIDSSLRYLEKAKPIVTKLNNHRISQLYYNKLARISMQKKEYRKAIGYFEQSIIEARVTNTKYKVLSNQRMIGKCYVLLGEFTPARQYLLLALPDAIAGKYNSEIISILEELITIEEKTNNIPAAYGYLTQVAGLKDSLNQENSRKAVAEIENKYQAAEKGKEIVQLSADKQIQSLSIKQKSTLNYFLTGSLASILIVGFLVYRNFYNRHLLNKQQDELQQQRIRELEKDKQLVAVDSMFKAQEEERSRMARDLHDGLGGMLSGVKLSLGAMKGNIILSEDNTRLFSKVLGQLDHSISEMRRVAHNMMPEALVKLGLQQAIQDYCDGLNESIQLHFKVQFHGLENRLEAATEIVVYRIVQELLNNVVKHADATIVLVQVMRHENNLNITIEDNGKGFDVSSSPKGDGLNNVRSRVDYLKGQLDIQSVPGKGTSIHIDFTIQDT